MNIIPHVEFELPNYNVTVQHINHFPIIKEYKTWEQYWTSPGVNTQDTNYTATCLPSRKLYKLDEQDTQGTAGEARMNSSVMYSYGPPHMAKQKQDDQLEHTYSSYVRIRDITLKTCQRRWMIGRSGERGSGISVLAARLDDDDDDDLFSGDTARIYRHNNLNNISFLQNQRYQDLIISNGTKYYQNWYY